MLPKLKRQHAERRSVSIGAKCTASEVGVAVERKAVGHGGMKGKSVGAMP